MNSTAKFSKYSKAHHLFVIDLIRFLLGIVIFIEGIRFVSNSSMLSEIIDNSRIGGLAIILEHHVAFSLLAGGFFIAIGLLTRIAILFQLPIFIGVLLNYHAVYGLFSVYGNATFSLIITFVLLIIFISGSGKYSIDYLIKKKRII